MPVSYETYKRVVLEDPEGQWELVCGRPARETVHDSGDAEIGRIHPYERTLAAWRRQPDGSHAESLHTTGTIVPVALPSVTIDIELLFE